MSPRTSQGRPSTDGAEADLSFALPLLTEPMEAKSEARLPDENGPWQYESKWDGFRCLAFKSGTAV
jgi:ATP-dependent DNA ligase